MSNISSQSVYSERLNIAGKKQNDEKRFERVQSKKTQQELILIDDMVRYWNIQLTFKTEEIRIDYLTDFDQTVADWKLIMQLKSDKVLFKLLKMGPKCGL